MLSLWLNNKEMIDLELYCKQVVAIAGKAAKFIQDQRQLFTADQVESKGSHDYVSYVDKKAEELIVAELSQLLPQAGFITEEGTVEQSTNELTWIIDPLDGTTNFIHGLDPFAVSIALCKQTEVLIGVVYLVGSECFYAWKGGGAYVGSKKISVSSVLTLDQSLLISGLPYTPGKEQDAYFNIFKHLCTHTHGMRRFGSAAADIAYVAAGRAEVFFQTRLQAWDVAAGILIAQEAGAIVTDFSGGDGMLFGKNIVVCNPYLHSEILALLQNYFEGYA